MAFVKAEIISINKTKDSAGVVDGILIKFRLYDDAISETLDHQYHVTRDEFQSLPTGAAAKRAALIAIVKREARDHYAAWKRMIAERPKASVVGDPLTDLGVTEFTDFVGAANPQG